MLHRVTRRTRAATLLGLSLLAGCASIGNQHFYGLEPTRQAPIDRVIYRFARAWEQTQGLVDAGDDEKTPRSLADLLLEGRLCRLVVSGDTLSVEPVASEEAWRALDAHKALVRLELGKDGRPDIELDDSDQMVATFPEQYFIPHFQSGVLRLRHHYGYRFQLVTIGAYAGLPGRRLAVLRLTESAPEALWSTTTAERSPAVTTQPPTGAQDSDSAHGFPWERYANMPQNSFRPTDAEFPLHAIAPTLNPGRDGERIGPGMPLTLLANRLYMGRIGELLGDMRILTRLDSGEIAVVVSVSEGAAEQQTFLAFYHDQVARKTFVPSWGAVLYSTESWSGDPLTIKLQVFDLDGEENAFLQTLLGTAAEAVAQVRPEARSAVGIAGALGDLLVKQNRDNEIMRFEFTFVNDPGSPGGARDVLVPFDRSYIVLRPDTTDGQIPPEQIRVDDQWRLRHVGGSCDDNGVDPLDSYFTFTISSTVQVPAALMSKRQAAFDQLVESGQMQRLSPAERRAAAVSAAHSLTSAVEFVQLFQRVTELGAQGPGQELLSLARDLADDEQRAAGTLPGEPLLIASDRASLLATLKRLQPETLRGASDWAGVVSLLEPAAPAPAPAPDDGDGDGDGDGEPPAG